jgi:hypothetical protein
MPDEVPHGEPPTPTLISRVVSYTVAVIGGILICVASVVAAGGDFLAPLSFRGFIAVPMWVPFALGVLLIGYCVVGMIAPIRILARRARERRNPAS